MCRRTPLRLALLASALQLSSCAEPASGLREVSARSGVRFTHENGFHDSYAFPETMGSGVALVDLDGDGALDLYALQGGPLPGSPPQEGAPAELPRNQLWLGRGDGDFEAATERAGAAAHSGFAMGVCAGDLDGDGSTDLFVTNFGPDALLLNDGNAHFREGAAGTPLANPNWNTACGLADLDRDGHLDLVVIGYVELEPQLFRPCVKEGIPDYCDVAMFKGARDRVWRGDGHGGFEDWSAGWGLSGARGKGLGLTLADLDDDGDADLYVANDSVANQLYLNRGDGHLEDRSDSSGAALNMDGKPEAGMGIAVGDVNRDQRPDLFVTNFTGESNTLYVSTSPGRYRDRSRPSGLTHLSRKPLGFGTAFADLNLDGVQDLLVTNGHVLRNLGTRQEIYAYRQADQAFKGIGKGRFEAWDTGPDLGRPGVGRGLALGDLDGDGDLDVALSANGERLRLLRNDLAPAGARWLAIRLHALGTNTMAVGARVTLHMGTAGAQTRWVRSGTGYLSQDELLPRFGVPTTASAGRLEVRWPDGSLSEHPVPGWDRVLELRQSDS